MELVISLDQNLSLKRARDYSAPRRTAELLPLVYGDMRGGQGGLWTAACLDVSARVYGLAGHPLLPLAAGNQVSLFDRDGRLIDEDDYALNLAHDFQGQGLIATAAFHDEAGAREPIAVCAQGKPDAQGCLLENPLDVVQDLLTGPGGLSPDILDRASFSRARNRAQALGYQAAGAVTRSASLAGLLTEMLGDFLGSWWQGADGRLKLGLDMGPGSLDEGELVVSLVEAHLKNIQVSARLANLCNLAQLQYCYNPRAQLFEAVMEDEDGQDRRSQGLHGVQARTFGLKWVRQASTARTLARRAVAMLAWPRRVITCEEDALINLALEKGDPALLSVSWLGDELGRPLVNQIVRVLSLEPALDRGSIRFTLLDTGYCKTTARLADGSALAQGDHVAGGLRDRREY